MALSKSVNLEHAQTAVPCNVCEDETPGEYYCIECKHTLCPPCEKYHRKFTKGHNVVLRTQLGDIDTTVLTCTDHGDQASFHCEKCNIPVCGKCITGKHRGHEMSDLDDLFDRKKKVLQNDITRMEESLCKLKKEREEFNMEKKTHDDKIRQITTDMETEIEAAHKVLDRIHNERMGNLASIRQSHSSICDGRTTEINNTIDILENRIAEYKETMKKNSLPAVIHLSRRKESIPETGSKPEIPELPVYVSGCLQKLGEHLAKLQFSYSLAIANPRGEQLKVTTPTIVSRFKCPLQGSPSICITKEGDVWFGGYGSRELVMVGITGQVLRRRKIQNRPTALAVMDSGEIIICSSGSDAPTVTRLLKDGREQDVFDASPSYNYGVSITSDQKILICTKDGRVMRSDHDSKDVREIFKGFDFNTAIQAVGNIDGNIYITDKRNSAVVIVGEDGKAVSKITQTEEKQKLSWPLGLVVDKMENILCTDYDKGKVYIINQDLQLKTLIDCSLGHTKPRWLAVDNDNNLWITHRDRTVLVVKYLA